MNKPEPNQKSPSTSQVRLGACLIAGAALLTCPATATLINVDFNLADSTGAPTPTFSGSAVIGNAGDTWNGIVASTGSGSGLALVDSTGSATGVQLSFTGSNGFYDANNSFNGTGYDDLMDDYLYASDEAMETLSLSGLSASSAFDLVLYSNPNLGRERSTQFTVNSLSETAASTGTDTTFIEGINYVRFENAMSDTLGNLTVSYQWVGGTSVFHEANVNGFQIMSAAPVPEPSALILMVTSLFPLAVLLRRRRS